MSEGPLTVRGFIGALLDLPSMWGDSPTMEAVVQFTGDGESFFVVESIESDTTGALVAQLVPFPSEAQEMGEMIDDG